MYIISHQIKQEKFMNLNIKLESLSILDWFSTLCLESIILSESNMNIKGYPVMN